MNAKIWNLYKESQEYRRLVDIFTTDTKDIEESFNAIFNLSEELGDDKPLYKKENVIEHIYVNFFAQGYEFVEDFTKKDYEDFVDNFELHDFFLNKDGNFELVPEPAITKDDYRSKSESVDSLSTFFYFNHAFFKPVLLSSRFNIIQRNCEILGIELPPYPKAHDYKAALMWYYDICEAFNEFQHKYEMTNAEFCACLYGLGNILSDEREKTPLPKPVNVWLTGASKEDIDELENGIDNDLLWTCNENTRRGDIIVLYAIAPNSCIHSIFRADSEGTFNPFDHFQHRTRVVDGVKVSRISLKELKADPEFGKLPMLNNNLMGVNGKHLPSWAYSALLKMIEAKGDDMSKIPVLYETKGWNPGVIKREKDVEDLIVKPFLYDLGYDDGDWTQQLRMKSGRKEEREIPDFVFFSHGEKSFENAPFLIEAKWKMKSEKDRNDAYRQALSYARMLHSSIFGICDEERLILYSVKNGQADYNSPVFESAWAAIAGDEETHSRCMQLIGAEVIKGLLDK